MLRFPFPTHRSTFETLRIQYQPATTTPPERGNGNIFFLEGQTLNIALRRLSMHQERCLTDFRIVHRTTLIIFIYFFLTFTLYPAQSKRREPGNLMLRHKDKTFPLRHLRSSPQSFQRKIEE